MRGRCHLRPLEPVREADRRRYLEQGWDAYALHFRRYRFLLTLMGISRAGRDGSGDRDGSLESTARATRRAEDELDGGAGCNAQKLEVAGHTGHF